MTNPRDVLSEARRRQETLRRSARRRIREVEAQLSGDAPAVRPEEENRRRLEAHRDFLRSVEAGEWPGIRPRHEQALKWSAERRGDGGEERPDRAAGGEGAGSPAGNDDPGASPGPRSQGSSERERGRRTRPPRADASSLDPGGSSVREEDGPAGDDPAEVADFIMTAARGRDGSPHGRRRRVAGERAEKGPSVEVGPEAERAARRILDAGRDAGDEADDAVRTIMDAGD